MSKNIINITQSAFKKMDKILKNSKKIPTQTKNTFLNNLNR